MRNFNIKSFVPHIIAIVLFVVITMVYLSPLLEGKQLKQGDITNFQGVSKEIADYRAATGKEALWTNRMFGGMPAYQISVVYKTNLINYIDRAIKLWLPHPAGLIFLYFLGFYILLLVLGVDKRLGIVGAIAFAFSSYFFIILDAGHNSKANAIGYMAPVIAGIILTFNGRYWLGAAVTTFFLALEINANHLQITYYLLLIIIILGMAELVSKFKEKEFKKFFRAIGILVICLFLAAGANIANLWSTYEYGKDSTRSKSELTSDKANKTTGLDRDYATDWSYGKMETFTLLIPNFMGGSSQQELTKSSDTYKALKENGIQGSEKFIKSLPLYWGDQPFTSGPVYVGAIMVFLFILGLFIVKGKYKWWLLSATILSVFLAWGKNMMWFSDFFFDYIPGYNKFRAVSMTLVIAEFCIPLLGLLALKNIFSNDISKEIKLRSLKFAGAITLGLIVIFGFFSGAFFDFISAGDQEMKTNGYPDWLISSIQSDRHGILLNDSFWSFILIALTVLGLWFFSINKLKKINILIVFIGILVLFDMWTVDKRYLNSDNFVSKNKMNVVFTESKCDEIILSDNSKDYRVLNLNNPFNDAYTSYYHNSIGGYHGAKLKRYQELIETRLYEEILKIKNAFSAKPPDSALYVTLKKLPVLNMLNTKYIIYNPEAPPLKNPNALGNAWFIDNFRIVANADSEIVALNNFNPASTAIVDKRFESKVSNYKNKKDSASVINLESYQPNNLVYKSKTTKDQLAVFSEIYYNKGWNVYIDGKPGEYFRTNYILRAMIIPAGEHKIEWKFEPVVYYTGIKASLAFNLLLIIAVLGFLVLEIKGKKQKT
ncbi:MAG: YfhO family protein [Bacteroidales bacterium]